MNKWNRFVDGVKNLTQVQQLHSKMVGELGTIVGLVFASVFLCLNGFWYFIIVMAFSTLISFISFIGTRQQWVEAKRIEEELKKYQGNDVELTQ